MTQESRGIDVEGGSKSFYKALVFCRNCRFDGEMELAFGKAVPDGICTNCGCKQLQHQDASREPVAPVYGPSLIEQIKRQQHGPYSWQASRSPQERMQWDLSPEERKHVLKQLGDAGMVSQTTLMNEMINSMGVPADLMQGASNFSGSQAALNAFAARQGQRSEGSTGSMFAGQPRPIVTPVPAIPTGLKANGSSDL